MIKQPSLLDILLEALIPINVDILLEALVPINVVEGGESLDQAALIQIDM